MNHTPPISPPQRTFEFFDRGFNGSVHGDPASLRRISWPKTCESETDREHLIDLYDAEIFINDKGFAQFLSLLKRTGRYENALIILLADHGEAFNEHGVMFHGFSLNRELLHIPLIVRFPRGRFAGNRISRLASILDVFPTILSQANISNSSEFDGIDLIRLMSKPTSIAPRHLYAKFLPLHIGKLQLISMLNESGYKRILHIPRINQRPAPPGSTGLFDTSVDPNEQTDLSISEFTTCLKEDARLLAWYSEQKESPLDSQANNISLSDQERRELRTLGYLR